MQGILLDNWSVENIVTCNSEDNCKSYNKEYIDLLEAVILWDNLYYPENEYSTFWKYFGQDQSIKKIIKPLQYAEVDFADEIEKILKDVPYLGDFKEIVAKGAIKYLLLSNKNGLNYYPCEKRSIFLEQNNFLYNLLKDKELINRLELMRIFDGEIIKYYEELNNFFKKNIFTFKIPLLADYIIQNTPKNMSHIDYALKIRNEKSVIAYRNYLKEIEVAFNNSQWDKLKTFEEETKGLVKDIYKDKKIFEYSISMNLLALPSIGISTGNLSIKRKIHFSFLRKLGRFACKERKMID